MIFHSNPRESKLLQQYFPSVASVSASFASAAEHSARDDGKDTYSSHFLKTVCLHDWWLVKAEKEFEGKNLAVAGFSSGARQQAVRVFSSAPIINRYDIFTLETADGIYVVLKGFINKSRTNENGFCSEIFRHFLLGFPPDWEEYAEKYFRVEVNTSVVSKSKYCFNQLTSHSEMEGSENVSSGLEQCNVVHLACDKSSHAALKESSPNLSTMINAGVDNVKGDASLNVQIGNGKNMGGLNIGSTNFSNPSMSKDSEIFLRCTDESLCRTSITSQSDGSKLRNSSTRISRQGENQPCGLPVVRKSLDSYSVGSGHMRKFKEDVACKSEEKHILTVSDVEPHEPFYKISERKLNDVSERNCMLTSVGNGAECKSMHENDVVQVFTPSKSPSEPDRSSVWVGDVECVNELTTVGWERENDANNDSFQKQTKQKFCVIQRIAAERVLVEDTVGSKGDDRDLDMLVKESDPSTDKKAKSSIISPESLNCKRSRSGRLLLPPLDFWRNQMAVYDAERQITGIQEGRPAVASFRVNKSKRRKY